MALKPGQVTVRLDTRPLTALIRAMPGRTRAVVKKNAIEIRRRAQSEAHVITGSMRESIYVSLGREDSEFASARTSAQAVNKYATFENEQFPSSSPGARVGAIVGVAVTHGYYEEVRRGHKFLLPAAEAVKPAFIQDCSKDIVVVGTGIPGV